MNDNANRSSASFDAEFIEAAKLCIEKGNDVNAVNSQGFTAVIGAANRGFDAMIKLLVEHGAKLDVKDKQARTPMTFAASAMSAYASALMPVSARPMISCWICDVPS